MWVLGFSVNTLTLLSMVLAIGLVVDDAIVMLENIYRHIERGLHPIKAALLGAREIQFAIICHHRRPGRGLRAGSLHGGPNRPPVRRIRADPSRAR